MPRFSATLRPKYWIFKSEPSTYSIKDFEHDGKTWWTGVRNYQARNYMRDMLPGEGVFFYHSSCPQPGIVGLGHVCHQAISEETDDKGQWSCVQLQFEGSCQTPLTLTDLKRLPWMSSSPLVARGNRLSIIPVTLEQAQRLLQLMV